MIRLTLPVGVLRRSLHITSIKASAVYTKEAKIDVGGAKINYVQRGNGSKALLLMPGALGSSVTDFGPQLEHLPAMLPNYSIIAWDPPGYGKSIPPSRDFSLEFFQSDAKCAVALMSALDKSKFSICGWSDGGITALIIAGTFKTCVEKLVIWGTGAYINEDEVKVLNGIKDVNKWSARMREPMENMYGKENFARLWSAWVDAVCAFHTQRQGDFCKQEVDKIESPTLILHGKKDPMIAAEHIPYLKMHIPGCSYYEFPDGKHNIHLRYAAEFNKIVSNFLNQL